MTDSFLAYDSFTSQQTVKYFLLNHPLSAKGEERVVKLVPTAIGIGVSR